jgi:hypothetical protein
VLRGIQLVLEEIDELALLAYFLLVLVIVFLQLGSVLCNNLLLP